MNKIQWVGSLALLFVMILMVVVALNQDPIRMPEYNSILHTGYLQNQDYSILDTINSVRNESAQHAPLYFVILTIWYELTSIHPIVLRILSLYFALLTAAFTYRIGRQLDSKWGGLIALFLLTFSAFNLFYSHEIRNYTMLSFASVLLIWTYWRAITSTQYTFRTKLVWLYLASICSVYVHYFSVFTLIGIGIYHIAFAKKNRSWIKIIGVEILAGISFLPWIPVVINGTNSRKDLVSDSQNVIEVICRHLFIYSNGLWWVVIGLVCIIVWRLWASRKHRSLSEYLVVIAVIMVLMIAVVNEISTVLPIRRMRYTMVWLPQITLVVTFGILCLSKFRWLQMGILIAWFTAFIWMNNAPIFLEYSGVSEQGGERYPNYQVIFDNQSRLRGEGETIISVSKDVWVIPSVLDFYQALTGYEILHITDDVSQFERPNKMWQLQTNNLESTRGNYSFWLLTNPQYTNLYDVTIFQLAIPDYSRPCITYIDTETTYLAYYLRNDLPCELVNEPTPKLEYNNGLQLLNFVSEQKDDQLEFYTWWDNLPKESYGFSVQLFDTDGNKVAQGDYFLPPGTIQISKLDVSTLESGEYDAQIVLYDVETASSQSGIISARDESFDRIVSVDRIVLNASSSD